MPHEAPFTTIVVLWFWPIITFIVALFVLMFFVSRRYEGPRQLQDALWILKHQSDTANHAMLSLLARTARNAGRSSELAEKIADIRRVYGHDGLRVAHVLWLHAFIHGHYPLDAMPPSFDGSGNGPDLAEFCQLDQSMSIKL